MSMGQRYLIYGVSAMFILITLLVILTHMSGMLINTKVLLRLIVTSSANDQMFEIFGPIFEQNANGIFEPIFEQNVNFGPIFEKMQISVLFS